MKRAKRFESCPGFLQRDRLAHKRHDVRSAADAFEDGIRYKSAQDAVGISLRYKGLQPRCTNDCLYKFISRFGLCQIGNRFFAQLFSCGYRQTEPEVGALRYEVRLRGSLFV